jgi:bacterioferritin
MKGNDKVIKALNEVLTRELTAINQYFLHARMLQDWGMEKIGELEYKASIDEMKHADQLIKRILFLEGLPNVQRMEKVNIGQDIVEVMEADLKVENDAVPVLKESIALCEDVKDFVSRDLFTSILESEEEHIDWLETQLGLVQKIGKENFIQSQIES